MQDHFNCPDDGLVNDDSQKTIVQRIRAVETWERADWLMRWKGWSEGADARIIKSEDYLPMVLGVAQLFLSVLPLAILLVVAWRINRILGYVVLGISVPLGLASSRFIDYLVKRYVTNSKQ